MYKYNCLNPIAEVGLERFNENYVRTEDAGEADAILVRSAAMHEMDFSSNLKLIARAGAGVNNIPLDKCAEKGIVVFNTPGANANGVKELVIAGMLLAARDIIGGINWVWENEEDGNIAKMTEKKKKPLPEQNWKVKNWVSSALEQSAYWLQMQQHTLEWKYMVTIHTYQSMQHGSFPEASIMQRR